MMVVHIKLLGVEIRGVVFQVTLTINLLHIVVILRHLQEQLQTLGSSNELRICTVHQLHPRHLFQGDWFKQFYHFCHYVSRII